MQDKGFAPGFDDSRAPILRILRPTLLRKKSALEVKEDTFDQFADSMKRYDKRLTTKSWASGGAIQLLSQNSLVVRSDYEQDSIIVEHRNGSITRFEDAIEKVMAMWDDIFSEEEEEH